MASRLTAEQRLILQCIRRSFTPEGEPAPNDAVNWARFAQLAIQDGVGPLVYAGLASSKLQVPDEIRASLRSSYTVSLLRTRMGLAPTLVQTIGALHAARLDPIVLKGAALAYLAYRQPHDRTMVDIDLLVPGEQLMAADEAMRDLGFTVADVELGHGHHHLPPYVSPDRQFAVELHHHLLPEPNPYGLDLEQLRSRAHVRTLAGVQVRVLAPADAVLHVCLHLSYGHRYQWYSSRALMDILVLTSGPEGLDWDLFINTVLSSQTAGAVYWPLRLSRVWLGAPVPDFVLARIAPTTLLRRAMEPVLESSFILDGQAPEGLGSGVLYSLVRELSLHTGCSTGEQLATIWRCLFPPPAAITHLPEDVRQSSLRYALQLGHPGRAARGGLALWRLLTRQPRETEPQ